MTSDAGVDTCGRCMLSKLQQFTATDQVPPNAFSRSKRDLGNATKKEVGLSEECPCSSNEERDACGVCRGIDTKEINGMIKNTNTHMNLFILIILFFKKLLLAKT